MELTDYEKGFLAGFIDADGSIILYHKKKPSYSAGIIPVVSVSFANNNEDILKYIQRMLGVEHLKIRQKKGTKGKLFEVKGTKAYELLKQIRLIIKEHRRLVAVELANLNKPTNQYTIPEGYRAKVKELVTKFYNPVL